MAKTTDLADGDARLAWSNLIERYAPQGSTDLIHLTGEFNNCILDSSHGDPDVWFIKLETIRSRLSSIDTKYTKEDYKVVAHIVNNLPEEDSDLVTLVESMTTTITLVELKSKNRTFYTRKLKTLKLGDELALAAVYKQFKGLCRKCGKQGHKASECRNKDPMQNKGIKCFNCNRYAGHIARDCPEPKREVKMKNKSNESGMFVGICQENGPKDPVVLSEVATSIKLCRQLFLISNFSVVL
jgi:hypothetical protein